MNKLIALLLFTVPCFAQHQYQEEGWVDHSGNYILGLPGPYGSYWEDSLTFNKYNAHLSLNHIEVQIKISSRHRWAYTNIAPPWNIPVFITNRNEVLSLYVTNDIGVDILVATLRSPIEDRRTMAGSTGHILTEWRTFTKESGVFTITDGNILALFKGPGQIQLKITSLNNVLIDSPSYLYIWHAQTITRGRVILEYHQ